MSALQSSLGITYHCIFWVKACFLLTYLFFLSSHKTAGPRVLVKSRGVHCVRELFILMLDYSDRLLMSEPDFSSSYSGTTSPCFNLRNRTFVPVLFLSCLSLPLHHCWHQRIKGKYQY